MMCLRSDARSGPARLRRAAGEHRAPQIAAGYVYLAPGEFLRELTAGRGYSYPFVRATIKFSAR